MFKENKRHPRKLHRKPWTHHGIHSLTLGSNLTMECATSWQPHVSGRLELTLCHAKSHCREINTRNKIQYKENNAVIRDNMLLSLFDKKYMGETLPQLRWMTIRVFASVTKSKIFRMGKSVDVGSSYLIYTSNLPAESASSPGALPEQEKKSPKSCTTMLQRLTCMTALLVIQGTLLTQWMEASSEFQHENKNPIFCRL